MAYQFYKEQTFLFAGNNGKSYQPAVVETFNGKDTKDGVNILILGSDQRVSQDSTDARTDSIMVVNVGNKEGKIKMVSFMRDTLVNIKGASETDYSQDLKLNTAFNIGEQNNHQGQNSCVRPSNETLTLILSTMPWLTLKPLRQGSIPSSRMVWKSMRSLRPLMVKSVISTSPR